DGRQRSVSIAGPGRHARPRRSGPQHSRAGHLCGRESYGARDRHDRRRDARLVEPDLFLPPDQRPLRRALTIAAIVVSLAAVGCAGDPPPRSGPPTAAPPALEANVRNLGSGVVNLSLDPGRPTDLDPIQLATSLGITPPSCADFVMSFTWQVQTAAASDAP